MHRYFIFYMKDFGVNFYLEESITQAGYDTRHRPQKERSVGLQHKICNGTNGNTST